VREKKALFDGHGSFSETPSPFQGEKSASLAFPGKGIVALPFHEPGGQFIKRFARWKLVSGPVLDGETPVCAALSLLVKFRFLAAFDGPTGNWFESYEPSSLRCLRDRFDMTACLARSSSPLRSTTQSFEPAVFPETAKEPAIGGLLRLRFGLRGDRFWPEGDFGRSVSGPRNSVSPMQIDLG
jgi:hypothetical protein